MSAAAPSVAKLNDQWGKGWWVMPLAVVLFLGGFAIRQIIVAPDPATLSRQTAIETANRLQTDDSAPPVTEAPRPAYFDYLGCAVPPGMPEDPACEPLLIWPLTAEARSVITGESKDLPGLLNMVNSKAVARQVMKLGSIDQCLMSIGIEEDKGIRRRVVYPDLRKTKLVDCGTTAVSR